MALNLFRKKDKPAEPAESPTQEADPSSAAEDQPLEEPLAFQEVEDSEVSEDLPQGLATTSVSPWSEATSGAAATTTVQRKRTRAHAGTPAKGKRAARGKARSRTASRARPAPKKRPARKTNQRTRTSTRSSTSRSRKKK